MSTRGSTWLDDDDPGMDWTPDPKPWCPSCCVPLGTRGCPVAEAALDDLRTQHLDGMGTE